jgi:hypothetical protein
MTHTSLEGNPRLPLYPVRVFRQKPGGSHYVRLLAASYGGCFTHYLKDRGEYCAGPGCMFACQKLRKIWRGYGAADYWDDASQLWIPTVLELTETLELDFRDKWRRGQVWKILTPHKQGKKNLGKSAKLLEQLDPGKIPHEFDIVPALLNTFHIFEIDLTHKNPMPPRVLVAATAGAPPGSSLNQVRGDGNQPAANGIINKMARDFADRQKQALPDIGIVR